MPCVYADVSAGGHEAVFGGRALFLQCAESAGYAGGEEGYVVSCCFLSVLVHLLRLGNLK